jgi:hypothetical protein
MAGHFTLIQLLTVRYIRIRAVSAPKQDISFLTRKGLTKHRDKFTFTTESLYIQYLHLEVLKLVHN